MKSKAHMKKCLELGVSVTSVDETEAEEPGMIQILDTFYLAEPILQYMLASGSSTSTGKLA